MTFCKSFLCYKMCKHFPIHHCFIGNIGSQSFCIMMIITSFILPFPNSPISTTFVFYQCNVWTCCIIDIIKLENDPTHILNDLAKYYVKYRDGIRLTYYIQLLIWYFQIKQRRAIKQSYANLKDKKEVTRIREALKNCF